MCVRVRVHVANNSEGDSASLTLAVELAICWERANSAGIRVCVFVFVFACVVCLRLCLRLCLRACVCVGVCVCVIVYVCECARAQVYVCEFICCTRVSC